MSYHFLGSLKFTSALQHSCQTVPKDIHDTRQNPDFIDLGPTSGEQFRL